MQKYIAVTLLTFKLTDYKFLGKVLYFSNCCLAASRGGIFYSTPDRIGFSTEKDSSESP